MSATIPGDLASDLLGVHPLTLRKWVRAGLVAEAEPRRGPYPARYEVAELHRWVRECTDDHGAECRVHHEPFTAGVECGCVACHCGPLSDPSGWMGSCARCYRPIVRDGQVVR